MIHRMALVAALAASIVALFGVDANAQSTTSYPEKAVRIVVPFPAGGATDIVARVVGERLSGAWNKPVVIENISGAAGASGTAAAAKAAPDGYSLLTATGTTTTLLPHLRRNLPYDPLRDFEAVSLLCSFPNILVVNPAFPAKSVAELIALAKAQPGRIAFASSGPGSAQHLAGELFRQAAGLDMVHVPYKGGGPALQDVIGGQVPIFFANMASGFPHVKAGRLRALAITGTQRSPAAPDLPTVAESGLPGYEVYEWNGIFAPAGTPKAIVDRLYAEFSRALHSTDVKERIASLGGEVSAMPPREFAAWLAAQMDKWARVVDTAHIKLD